MPERAGGGSLRENVPCTVSRIIRRPVVALAAVATLFVAGCGGPPKEPPDQPVDVETAVPDDSTDAFPTTTTSPAPSSAAVSSIPAPPPAPKPTPAPKPKPKPALPPPAPKPAPKPAPRASCDPSYPTVCIPPAPPDLDCGDVPYDHFQVVGADPHGFDNDHDGVGCES
jgi:hypothetical protein